jgi:hypothetical protein
MDWMWECMKATLIPWLIVGIVVGFVNHTLFQTPLSPHHDRRTFGLTYIKEMME